MKKICMIDGNGQPFCDRDADKAMFDAIKANLKEGVAVAEMGNNINDPEFSARGVERGETTLEEQAATVTDAGRSGAGFQGREDP